jgi:DNA polymerase-3 subunit delta'
MRYDSILGLDHIKNHLQSTVANERIAHAQLFIGPTGSGLLPLAIAYARAILCKNGSAHCDVQIDALSHPDLHFSYPIASSESAKEKPVADDYIRQWRTFVKEEPYGDIAAWSQAAGLDKKELLINVHEAAAIGKKLSLKAYEGGYKILIIWAADHMNVAAANKLLKLIEEPPAKTVILLLAVDEEKIIKTIQSRCQVLHVPKLPNDTVAQGLVNHLNISVSQSQLVARQSNGDFFKAQQLLGNAHEDTQFEAWFIQWVRTAFKAKGNKSSINDLITWSETIAALNRDTQKRFLGYCLEFFRQALLLNYKAAPVVYLKPTATDFLLEKFAPFIDGHRIVEINTSINDAMYHIERNGNSKIILTDLAISLTRMLHKTK